MKKLLLILLLPFLITDCYAQDTLNYGKVKADTAFNCKNDNSRWPDLGINSICNSVNEFELRLEAFNRPGSYKEMIVLTYNNHKWDVKKYQRVGKGLGELLTSSSYKYDYEPMKNYVFRLVFDTLRNKAAFMLPNQEELNLKGHIMDGAAYRLTFKVKNYFRSYWFENPEDFLEENPNVVELKQYISIVRILQSLF